jgi:hypothetical protein
MSIQFRSPALVALAAVFLTAAVAPLCPAGSKGVMECCKPAQGCAGIKEVDCCRFEPAREARQTPAVQTAASSKGPPDPGHGYMLVDALATGLVRAVSVPGFADTSLPFRLLTTPLFLLNASLLR